MHLHDIVKLICLVQFISSSKMLEVSNVSIEEPFATAIEESTLYGNRDECHWLRVSHRSYWQTTFRFPIGQDLFLRTVQTGSTVNQAFYSMATRVPAPGVKWTRHELSVTSI